MKISLKWLNDHVDVGEFFNNPESLAKKLTDVGLEVEEVESVAKKYKNVVVGEITKLERHPDADKLTCCEVNVGSETLKIVCGAENHKQGDKVCVAKVGAVLPGNFKIKKSKIRGAESFGMLCSHSELGLEGGSDGILILEKEASVGENFSKHYGLDDVLFEINVTPNRADCLSHLGLAREVSTLFNKPLKKAIPLEKIDTMSGREISLDLKEKDFCPRYIGQMIFGVKVGPSPDWIVQKLESIGLESINNVVDVTNYIMFDSGQPLHAFDADLINGDQIKIERSIKGETFTTLKGDELTLSGEELTIRDKSGALALAGVIGGEKSGVSEKTQNIFLEAAHFTPSIVRKASRSLGIDTDSSYRFSRGTDISRLKTCLDEAAFMITELAGGIPSKNIVEAYPEKKQLKPIAITKKYIVSRLGFEVSKAEVENCFKLLGFDSKELEPETWTVLSNDYRWDIQIKEDLLEEIGRIIGYEKIPAVIPMFSNRPQNENSNYKNFRKIREQFKGFGYHEAVHYNFYSNAQEVTWAKEISSLIGEKYFVEIQNPLSSDLSVMRTTSVPQFISNFIRNFRMGSQEGKIFEIGKAHYKKDEYSEHQTLTGAFWSEQSSDKLLRNILGTLSAFFNAWSVSNWKLKPCSISGVLHPKLTAEIILEGKPVGFVFAVNPLLNKNFKVSSELAGFELNLDQFLKGKPRPKKFKTFSRHPVVQRDFSLLVEKNYDYLLLEKVFKKASGGILKNLSVQGEYEGDKVPAGKTSLTLRAKFQSKEETLTEEALKKVQNKIMDELEKFKS